MLRGFKDGNIIKTGKEQDPLQAIKLHMYSAAICFFTGVNELPIGSFSRPPANYTNTCVFHSNLFFHGGQ